MPAYALEGELIVPGPGVPEWFELPLELLPRIAELAHNPRVEEILAFVREYGPLTHPWEWLVTDPAIRPVADSLGKLSERARRKSPAPLANSSLRAVFVEEVAATAAHLTALAVARWALEQESFSGAWLKKRWPGGVVWQRPENWKTTTALLVFGLNGLLAPLGPRLDFDEQGGIGLAETHPRTLPEVAAIELFNHIAEDWRWRHCHRETCRRLFARQAGRSVYESHRVDAIYCSKACAQAQAARDYRRRKKDSRARPARRGRRRG